MSWADAPVAGRRPCRWSSPIAGTDRVAPPRSAVAVSPIAPGLAPLTGFSRSGSPALLPAGSLIASEAPLRPMIGLARVLRLDVDTRWTTVVPSVSAQVGRGPVHRPPGLSQGPGGLFMYLAGREGLEPSYPGLEPDVLAAERAVCG